MIGRRIALSLAVIAVFGAAAACGGGTGTQPAGNASRVPPSATADQEAPPRSDESQDGTSDESAQEPSTKPTRSSAAGLAPPTSTAAVEVEREDVTPPMIKKARFAEHNGFDRVVIDIDGAVPGYSVRWVDELVQDGSGEPFDVEGGAYLQVSLRPANAHDESGNSVWAGGPIFDAGLENVRSVVRTGDFEAVVGVGLVLDHRAGFRVFEQKSPSRLVIDVAH